MSTAEEIPLSDNPQPIGKARRRNTNYVGQRRYPPGYSAAQKRALGRAAKGNFNVRSDIQISCGDKYNKLFIISTTCKVFLHNNMIII